MLAIISPYDIIFNKILSYIFTMMKQFIIGIYQYAVIKLVFNSSNNIGVNRGERRT